MFSHLVRTPSVVIEDAGVPVNGSEYILLCIVTVDDSVDTDIIILSQWLLPATEEMLPYDTLTYDTETVGNMEQRNNLTFNPLLFHHEETYICNASVTSLKKRTVDDRIAVAYEVHCCLL